MNTLPLNPKSFKISPSTFLLFSSSSNSLYTLITANQEYSISQLPVATEQNKQFIPKPNEGSCCVIDPASQLLLCFGGDSIGFGDDDERVGISRYDYATNLWIEPIYLSSTNPRIGHKCTLIDKTLYIYGGLEISQTVMEEPKVLVMVDLAENDIQPRLISLSNFPNYPLFILNSQLILVDLPTKRQYAVDVKSLYWQELQKTEFLQVGCSDSSVSDVVYCYGGTNASGELSSELWEIDTGGISIGGNTASRNLLKMDDEKTPLIPSPRLNPIVILTENNTLLIFGGKLQTDKPNALYINEDKTFANENLIYNFDIGSREWRLPLKMQSIENNEAVNPNKTTPLVPTNPALPNLQTAGCDLFCRNRGVIVASIIIACVAMLFMFGLIGKRMLKDKSYIKKQKRETTETDYPDILMNANGPNRTSAANSERFNDSSVYQENEVPVVENNVYQDEERDVENIYAKYPSIQSFDNPPPALMPNNGSFLISEQRFTPLVFDFTFEDNQPTPSKNSLSETKGKKHTSMTRTIDIWPHIHDERRTSSFISSYKQEQLEAAEEENFDQELTPPPQFPLPPPPVVEPPQYLRSVPAATLNPPRTDSPSPVLNIIEGYETDVSSMAVGNSETEEYSRKNSNTSAESSNHNSLYSSDAKLSEPTSPLSPLIEESQLKPLYIINVANNEGAEGRDSIAKRQHYRARSDEIEVHLGDYLKILANFQDQWCYGVNVSRGKVAGFFPSYCCTNLKSGVSQIRITDGVISRKSIDSDSSGSDGVRTADFMPKRFDSLVRVEIERG